MVHLLIFSPNYLVRKINFLTITIQSSSSASTTDDEISCSISQQTAIVGHHSGKMRQSSGVLLRIWFVCWLVADGNMGWCIHMLRSAGCLPLGGPFLHCTAWQATLLHFVLSSKEKTTQTHTALHVMYVHAAETWVA